MSNKYINRWHWDLGNDVWAMTDWNIYSESFKYAARLPDDEDGRKAVKVITRYCESLVSGDGVWRVKHVAIWDKGKLSWCRCERKANHHVADTLIRFEAAS